MNLFSCSKGTDSGTLTVFSGIFSEFFSEFFSGNVEDISSYHTTRHTEIMNILGNAYLTDKVSKSLIRKVWKALKYDFIRSHTDRHYIENNPYYLGFLDVITESFPDAKYVIVVRRPKDYIISHLNREYTRFKSKVANRSIPFWQPLPYRDHLSGWKIDFYQRVSFYAKVWEYKNRYLNKFQKSNGNARLLRFEDIFGDQNTEILRELLAWLDLTPVRRIEKSVFIGKVNRSRLTDRVQWDERCDETVANICGPLVRLLY